MNAVDKPGAFPSPVLLQSADGACATVSPCGAHVLSWRPTGRDERLFLSPRAEFRSGTPIRGGVPVIFPQFAGEGALPKKHGFARTALWRVAERSSSHELRLRLTEADASHALWPFRQ
jgi:glucose-6-phosphate 1-epimerase